MQQHKTGWFVLPYYKQGDDLENSLQTNEDGKIDIDRSLGNFISMFEEVINSVIQLKNFIASHPGDWELNGNTHAITVSGPAEYMDELNEQDIVELDDEDMQEEEEDDPERYQQHPEQSDDHELNRRDGGQPDLDEDRRT